MKTRLFLLFLSLLTFIVSCGKHPSPDVSVAADSTGIQPEVTQKIIHAGIYLKPEKVGDFIAAAKAMVDSSNMESGCISYQLYQDPYVSTKFMFVEIWKDQAAIDAHFNMPYFKAWGPKTADWLAQPTELKIFNVSGQQ